MEKYINEETIIKNDNYDLFQDMIICQICQCIMIEPVMCLGCQNYYCKNCIENWKKKSEKCPNRCENPIYQNIIEKNRIITKYKFKCIKGCGAEIPFENIKSHYDSNCLENKKEYNNKSIIKNNIKESKIKILSDKETYELKRKKKEFEYFTSKQNNIICLFLYSYYIRRFWCGKNFFNKYVRIKLIF